MIRVSLILFMIMTFCAPAAAEFYRYIDEDGNVRYTDDWNQVPVGQRPQIQSYTESESESEPDEPLVEEKPQEPQETSNWPTYTDESDGESLEQKKARIESLKQAIDTEYQALVAEKEKMVKEREKTQTRAEIIEYNKKVERLNQRVIEYEKKADEYRELVREYNRLVTLEDDSPKNE